MLNNYAVSRMLAGDLDGAQRLIAQASAGSNDFPKIANNVAMLSSTTDGGIRTGTGAGDGGQHIRRHGDAALDRSCRDLAECAGRVRFERRDAKGSGRTLWPAP